MEKFSKIQKLDSISSIASIDTVFNGEHIKIVKTDGWEVVTGSDTVIVLPYFVEQGQIMLRLEWVPTYNYHAKSKDGEWLTVISGSVEIGESPEEAALRELEEEGGIRLRSNNNNLQKWKEVYVSKCAAFKYHIFYLPLMELDYDSYTAQGDGSEAETRSRSIKISAGTLNKIQPADTITALCIELLKKELHVR
jgi:8-oxo-dGTP pyrophosphatase MutT (NUDIX family)